VTLFAFAKDCFRGARNCRDDVFDGDEAALTRSSADGEMIAGLQRVVEDGRRRRLRLRKAAAGGYGVAWRGSD